MSANVPVSDINDETVKLKFTNKIIKFILTNQKNA